MEPMADPFSHRKLVLLSSLTISSFAIFYWLYRRRKRETCVISEIKNDAVFKLSDSKCDISRAESTIYSERGIKVLVERLRGSVQTTEELENVMLTLLKTTAFTSMQTYFLECDGIAVTANNLKVEDERIKEIVLQIMNNMALHREGQKSIKNYIPQLAYIIHEESRDNLVIKSLQVLTNLSVLDECHDEIVKETSCSWPVLLQSTHFTVKIQTLKLLVNLSTNPRNAEVLCTSELLHQVSRFVETEVHHDLCLRSITYLANILSATDEMGKTSLKNFIVSIPGLKENTEHVSRSKMEDLNFQSNRALAHMC